MKYVPLFLVIESVMLLSIFNCWMLFGKCTAWVNIYLGYLQFRAGLFYYGGL